MLSRCEFTETVWERMVGLLGRKSLLENEGLWIDRCNSIHTFFMRFPIDAIFLDANGKVIKIYENLMPWRLSALHWRARSVLEVAAGQAKKLNFELGEVLELCDVN